MANVQELIRFYENTAIHFLNNEEFVQAIDKIPNAIIQDTLNATLEVLEEDIQNNPKNPIITQTDLIKLRDFISLPPRNKAPFSTSLEQAVQGKQASSAKVIIITSEGGAGHKEAATDSEKKLLAQGRNPHDIHKAFVVPPEDAKEKSWLQLFDVDIGKKAAKQWNKAQKEGDTKKNRQMVSLQWLSELIFGKSMEQNTFLLLTQNQEAHQVIDTFFFNSHKVLGAVAEYNRIRSSEKKCAQYNQLVKYNQLLRKIPFLKPFAIKKYSYPIPYHPDLKPVMLHKRMTDLPNRAEHFFRSLKKLKSRDLAYFTFEAPHAALSINDNPTPIEQREHDLAFYKKKCPNLFNQQGEPRVPMEFNEGPIRQAFLHYQAHPVDKSKEFSITLQAANATELDLVKKSTNLLSTESKLVDENNPNSPQTLTFTIPPQAQVDSVMLGSQAAIGATLAYIDAKIEVNRHKQHHTPQYLFVFCGKHDSENSLFAQVNQKIENEKRNGNLPASFTIVPLTYQNDNMIASLYSRADEAFIRAGGISCMEIEAVSHGKVFIHSEKSGAQRTTEKLLNAMLDWEKGNAEHVMTRLGKENVSIVNPQTYRKQALNAIAKKDIKQDTRKTLMPSHAHRQSSLSAASRQHPAPQSKKPKPHK